MVLCVKKSALPTAEKQELFMIHLYSTGSYIGCEEAFLKMAEHQSKISYAETEMYLLVFISEKARSRSDVR